MTDLKVAAAFVLAAGLFLVSVIGSGRGYRTASDLTLQTITADGSNPAAPSSPSASSSRTGASNQSSVEIERDVTYASADEYQDDDKDSEGEAQDHE